MFAKIATAFLGCFLAVSIALASLFFWTSSGGKWFSFKCSYAGDMVSVKDERLSGEMKSAVLDAIKEGVKVKESDYEVTYGSSLYIINGICPLKVNAAYSVETCEKQGMLVQFGMNCYVISDDVYETYLADVTDNIGDYCSQN